MKKRAHFAIKLVLMILLFSSASNANAQWKESFNYRGDWSSWQSAYGEIAHYVDDSGIILKTPGGQTYFSFQISNYIPPTKKQIKEHLKSGQWFEYIGTVEYSVNDAYPTAEALAKAVGLSFRIHV